MNEPTIVFLFDYTNWFETISVISKIDLIDIIPNLQSQFYYNHEIKTFVLIIYKKTWTNLEDKIKYKFSIIARRIKEEMEGPMSSTLKEKYENTDLFDLLISQANDNKIS